VTSGKLSRATKRREAVRSDAQG